MSDEEKNKDLHDALASLTRNGAQVQLTTVDALQRGIDRYSEKVADDVRESVLDKLRKGIESIVNPHTEMRQVAAKPGEEPPPPKPVTVGQSPATVRADIVKMLRDTGSPADVIESLNLDFKIRIASEVAHGAGRFLVGQTDVDEYPAWELFRMYPRQVPRLWRGDEGTEDKSLGAEFASRWYHSAQVAHDVDAARMLQDHGRMIALKSSGIWSALGDFPDGLHNPYPPFAFNSGMEVRGVPKPECVKLGILKPDQKPRGTEYDFNKLFSFAA